MRVTPKELYLGAGARGMRCARLTVGTPKPLLAQASADARDHEFRTLPRCPSTAAEAGHPNARSGRPADAGRYVRKGSVPDEWLSGLIRWSSRTGRTSSQIATPRALTNIGASNRSHE